MMTECPHCFTRVLPRRNGECPACQKDTTAKSSAEVVPIIYGEQSRSPYFCCTCALPTTRLVKVCHKLSQPAPTSRRFTLNLILVLAQLMTELMILVVEFIAKKSGGARDISEVIIHICQCRDCSRRSPIEPLAIDFDAGLMRLPVHRDFARYFEEENTAYSAFQS